MTECSFPSATLSDYVDGELAPEARAQATAHLAECDDCRGLIEDLARLRDTARGLGPITPPDHLWGNIQASLPATPRQTRWQWAGLAAALVLVTAGAYFFTRLMAPGLPSTLLDRQHAGTSNASAAPTVETVEQELAKAAAHYEAAITQLEAVARQDNNALPADAAAKLQVSLSQVDKFIAESRAALVSEPQNEPARDSLFSALRRKVEILQQTVALMGAMQRGDQPARVLDGKKS
jgi:anti-sigma factor RsiW